jgi:hypothetical protein
MLARHFMIVLTLLVLCTCMCTLCLLMNLQGDQVKLVHASTLEVRAHSVHNALLHTCFSYSNATSAVEKHCDVLFLEVRDCHCPKYCYKWTACIPLAAARTQLESATEHPHTSALMFMLFTLYTHLCDAYNNICRQHWMLHLVML